jgi:hypothetical protein
MRRETRGKRARIPRTEHESLAVLPGKWIVITDNDGADGWAETTVVRLPPLV